MSKLTFKELGLSDQIVEAVAEKGFESPTPIQEKIIPLLLAENQDVIGQAQTGTGKTAAFGLPIIEKLVPGDACPQALILTPTRELTVQVCSELNAYKGKKRLSIVPIYGGKSMEKQIQDLKGKVDIIVGTPGRVIDHIKRGRLKLNALKFLILDEADEMLNQGFIEDIEFVLAEANPDRNTLLFSATMPGTVKTLAKRYMQNPVSVSTKTEALTTSLTEQSYYALPASAKLEALCRIIDGAEDFYGFVFCRTKKDVDSVQEQLVERGYNAEALHGDLSQYQREKVLHKFRKRVCTILVVTDVAARGIDISDLTHVVNYAVPQDPESYVHRIGRTGRAGKKGIAITFVTKSDMRLLKYIMQTTQSPIEQASLPNAESVVGLKKKKLKSEILALVEDNNIESNFFSLAKTLQETADGTAIIAALLKMGYSQQLDESLYKNIAEANLRDTPRTDGKKRIRLFVAKGKMDGFNARKLVAFLESDSRIPGRFIHDVKILDKFSFVSVSEKDATILLKTFGPKKGRKALVTRAKDEN